MHHTKETDEVFPHAYTFSDGMLHPGEVPGLGVEIDEKLAAKFPYKRAYPAGEPAGRRQHVQLVGDHERARTRHRPHRLCPLVRLRASLRHRRPELYRPPGPERAQADLAAGLWLERDRLWLDGGFIPGRLWPGLCRLRPDRRPVRRQGGRHHRRHLLDHCPHRTCLCHQHHRVHPGAHSHGAGRVRAVSLHPGRHGGMVSPARAGAGHRHLQCRLQCRRDPGALHRAHHHHPVGMADGFHPHRASDLRLAGGVADLVSPPARDAVAERAGAGLYRVRSAATAAARALVQAARHPPDLGLHGGTVPDRSGVVDVPVLAAGFLFQTLWRGSQDITARRWSPSM